VARKGLIPWIKKNLTKHKDKEYGKLLYTIGISEEPLSSTQIYKKLGSKYIFERLKELCPTQYSKDKLLFKWEDVLKNQDNGRYKYKLIKEFNQVFELGWHVEEDNQDNQINDLNNNALITFDLSKNNTDNSESLTIRHSQSDIIIIINLGHKEIGSSRQRNARLEIFQMTKDSLELKKSPILVAERHKNKTSIYTLKRNTASIKGSLIKARYLDVTLKPKVEKLISDKRKQLEDIVSETRKNTGGYYSSSPKISDITLAEYFPDIAEMRDNRENWRYSLNLRGLILYLFHESNIIFSNTHSAVDKRKARHRIREVISNPLIIKKAPFLNFWRYFEKAGFNVVNLLLDISLEYINQLHIDAERDNYLLRRITERFFVELENIFYDYFSSVSWSHFAKKIGSIEEYNKIREKSNEYRDIIISYQKDWIREQQKVIDYFDKKCKAFKLEKEFYNTLDALEYGDESIISIDKLAQKYEMSSKDIHDFIFSILPHKEKGAPYYYTYKNKQYLVIHSCLISRSKLDKLKSLLFHGMDVQCAYSTLHKHSIPELCRYQLIYELGFWIISNSHYSDGYIIRIAANDVRLFKVTDYTLRPYRSRIEIVLIYLYGTIFA
jgi:hypothetical protein